MSITINVSELISFEKDKIFIKKDYPLKPIIYAGEEIPFLYPLKTDLTLLRIKSGILLGGKINAKVELACSRCLKKFSFKIEAEVRETFAFPENMHLFEEEEAVKEISLDKTIDIEPSIREMIILSIPIKPLCDPECKGLCPVCGTDLNKGECTCKTEFVDERLKILKKLRDSM